MAGELDESVQSAAAYRKWAAELRPEAELETKPGNPEQAATRSPQLRDLGAVGREMARAPKEQE
jgi:hypothetical protein